MLNLRPVNQDTGASRTLRVSRGLFVLRYVSSRASTDAPSVVVRAQQGAGIEVITPEFTAEGFLGGPGEAVVVRASRDSFLSVNVIPVRTGASRDAHLQLERISCSQASGLDASAPSHELVDISYPSIATPNLEIVAHVAMRGDLVVAAGEWVCGPQLPMAIEGIKLVWHNKPANVDIVTSGTIMARGKVSLTPAGTGAFMGTRGLATPLLSLGLTLTGSQAGAYTLICEALFLGSSLCSRKGNTIELSGPTGLEPLVGLRLSLTSTVNSQVVQSYQDIRPDRSLPVELIAGTHEVPASGKNGRVRVFRTNRSKTPSLQH